MTLLDLLIHVITLRLAQFHGHISTSIQESYLFFNPHQYIACQTVIKHIFLKHLKYIEEVKTIEQKLIEWQTAN